MSGVERATEKRSFGRKKEQIGNRLEAYRIPKNPVDADGVSFSEQPVGSTRDDKNWIVYNSKELEAYEKNSDNPPINYQKMVVEEYANGTAIVLQGAEAARAKKKLNCSLTEEEKGMIRAADKAESEALEDVQIIKYVRANDLAGALLKAAEGRISREETKAALMAAELPAHKKAEQTVEGGNESTGEYITASQIKDVVNDTVNTAFGTFAEYLSKHLSLQGPVAESPVQQPQNQPSPADFDDPQGADDFPFNLDENGCISGLDEKATRRLLQQYESFKKSAAGKGGNA